MKKLLLGFTLIVATLIFNYCVNSNTKTAKSNDKEKVSLLDDSLKNILIKEYGKTDLDKYVIKRLISDKEYELTIDSLRAYILSEQFTLFARQSANYYPVNIDNFAGLDKEKVITILGEPTEVKRVSPSGVGPSDKLIYLNGLVEIVYINNIADWITVNKRSSDVSGGKTKQYIFYNTFSDYTYAKYKTR